MEWKEREAKGREGNGMEGLNIRHLSPFSSSSSFRRSIFCVKVPRKTGVDFSRKLNQFV